ncbi:antibiotic biosynthesis monooxygenase [Sphingomonas sp. LB-2]|uniref:putative quinol monooxygenase n=1 Tax=Sphingomonas caeni TaxID=2984949 RepID=UPI00222FE8F6|nr:antibiotic biosynthesis monooxygenase [Sphingomonas caeni]MCW3847801.1 antibiotic biosynthesis monooxygenase [Sphingomonas caeni]
MIGRRALLGGVALAVLGAGAARSMGVEDEIDSYGFIGKVRCHPGKRAALAAVLNSDAGAMPGCILYLIAEDLKEADVLWITEIWESKSAHDQSLELPGVKAANAKGRPLIKAFEMAVETRPVLQQSQNGA